MKTDYQRLIGLINEAVIVLKQTGQNVSLAADLEQMNLVLMGEPADFLSRSRHENTLALASVLDEMDRQDRLWGADRNHNPFIWASILGEEFGEFNEAILHDCFGGPKSGTARVELAQVAAVAMQIIEYYDRLKAK